MELDHIALIVSKEENLAFYKKLGFIAWILGNVTMKTSSQISENR